jgi:hypothetical protein
MTDGLIPEAVVQVESLPSAATNNLRIADGLSEEEYLALSRRSQYESAEGDRVRRSQFADAIIGAFLPLWLVFVAATILYAGFRIIALSDAVLTTLLTTTTANVLGLGTIVLGYLFLKGKSDSS